MRSHEIHRPVPSRTEPPWFAKRAAKTLALTLALAFVLGACDVYALPGGGNSGDLTLSVAAPTDGAEVSLPFDVTVESNVSIGPPESGNHHIHLYFDGGTASTDYDIVYANPAQVTRQLAPGEHTIVASLRNADHSDAGASQTITVVVTDSGGSGSSPVSSAAPADDGY